MGHFPFSEREDPTTSPITFGLEVSPHLTSVAQAPLFHPKAILFFCSNLSPLHYPPHSGLRNKSIEPKQSCPHSLCLRINPSVGRGRGRGRGDSWHSGRFMPVPFLVPLGLMGLRPGVGVYGLEADPHSCLAALHMQPLLSLPSMPSRGCPCVLLSVKFSPTAPFPACNKGSPCFPKVPPEMSLCPLLPFAPMPPVETRPGRCCPLRGIPA